MRGFDSFARMCFVKTRSVFTPRRGLGRASMSRTKHIGNTPPLTDAEEAEIQRQISADPNDWASTDDEVAQARPFAEAFPDLMASIKRARRAQGLKAGKMR